MTTTSYPEVPPPEAPTALVKSGLWRCGLCATGNHGSCPGMVRNGRVRLPDDGPGEATGPRRLVQCYCCGTVQPQRCLDCGTTNSGLLVPEAWECARKFECDQRVAARQANNPLYRMLQACKSDAAERRRRIRESTLRILAEVPANEDELLEYIEQRQQKLRQQARPTSGVCECCGQPTRGGRFLPGHDAKLKSTLRRRARAGDVGAQAELEQRGWS